MQAAAAIPFRQGGGPHFYAFDLFFRSSDFQPSFIFLHRYR